MAEPDEFAEALLDQISVETDEEKNIADMVSKIDDDPEFGISFESTSSIAGSLFSEYAGKASEFAGMPVPETLKVEHAELLEFKRLKGRKVFAGSESRDYVDKLFTAVASGSIDGIAGLVISDPARYLVYSTYAKNYLSQISTTYGDILGDTIYLNKFILDSYPKIILYKQGRPFEAMADTVKSGYRGAVKMTLLEEIVHSMQKNLNAMNSKAVSEVNAINEDCANMILELGDGSAARLYEYLQLQTVPDEFPLAKKANLFFFLDPNFFLAQQLGPDIMTFSGIRIDPKISEGAPGLLEIYQRWLHPMQRHHAAFAVMEGMAEFAVQKMLADDADFGNYLSTFMGTDFTSYRVRKSIGRDFTEAAYGRLGRDAFEILDKDPPTTHELKDPASYIQRIS